MESVEPAVDEGTDEGQVENRATVAVQSVVALSPKCTTVPSARWGQSVCLISDNTLLLIGGQGDRSLLSKDSVWLLDLDRCLWTQPDIAYQPSSIQRPDVRMGHTVLLDPMLRSVYVFGGSKNKKWFSDLQVLDIDEWKWTHVQGSAPMRAYHSCSLYSHELWVFGGTMPGTEKDQELCSNDINVFNPFTEHWFTPAVTGTKPLPRSGHSAMLTQNQLIIFGGWEAPICYNDVSVLDLGSMNWSQPDVTGSPPSPRSWHSSCTLSGSRFLIHGGYSGQRALHDMFILDTDVMCWIEVLIEPDLSARTGHQCVCLPRGEGDKDVVVMFGGGDNEQHFFSQLIMLSIHRQHKQHKLKPS